MCSEYLRKVCPCLFNDKKTSSPSPDAGVVVVDIVKGGEGPQQQQQPPPPETEPESGRAVSPMPQEGCVYTATWSFDARHQDELSFSEGDLFSVTNRIGDWWSARRIDKNGCVLDTGIVPKNYLTRAEDVQTQPWYFGTMNRFEAQSNLLGPGNQESSFLIRQSQKDQVGYVLSVRSSSRVKHFKILTADKRNVYVEPNCHFSSLIDLVEHYCSNSLNNMDPLGEPCKRKKPEPPELILDEWELPKDQFTLGEQLGSGYFADVHRGTWKNIINVAIKILKSDSELNHREFQREVQILKSLRHRHLISLFAVCSASAPYYIITELMAKGSLLSFLRGEGQSVDVASLVDMAAQVADGMSYLEEQKSIHRDLAARNVLVGEDYICKVADFGLARVIKEPFYISDDKKIPYKWSAPEAISHGKFSNKSDVWSFGILLYEIITYGCVPYPAFSNQEVYQQVSNGYRMPSPATCPDFLYSIMLKCWSAEPEDRPDFKSLKAKLESSSYEMDSIYSPAATGEQ